MTAAAAATTAAANTALLLLLLLLILPLPLSRHRLFMSGLYSKGCPWSELMVDCWREDPLKRPSFREIVDVSTAVLNKMGGAPNNPDGSRSLVSRGGLGVQV